MSTIFETLASQLGGDTARQIGSRLGADPQATEKAVPLALGTLMGALAGNSSRSGGADALMGALARDHDGSILENLGGYIQSPGGGAGDGILKHVLGGKRATVEAGLAQQTGLDAGSAGQLLTMLAPVVMGALGRTRKEANLDAGGLTSVLAGEKSAVARQTPNGLGVLAGFLDSDGDGQIVDDVAKIGGSLLKKFMS